MELTIDRNDLKTILLSNRISTAAKLYKISNQNLIEKLNEKGESITSHLIKINERIAEKIIDIYGQPEDINNNLLQPEAKSENEIKSSETPNNNSGESDITIDQPIIGAGKTDTVQEALKVEITHSTLLENDNKPKLENFNKLTDGEIEKIAGKDIYRRAIFNNTLNSVHTWNVPGYKLYPVILSGLFPVTNELPIEELKYIYNNDTLKKFKTKLYIFKNEWRCRPDELYEMIIKLYKKYINGKFLEYSAVDKENVLEIKL